MIAGILACPCCSGQPYREAAADAGRKAGEGVHGSLLLISALISSMHAEVTRSGRRTLPVVSTT
jgi:hypothetical protein